MKQRKKKNGFFFDVMESLLLHVQKNDNEYQMPINFAKGETS